MRQATHRLETTVEAQLRLGGPDLVAIGGELLDVLRPALRQTMIEVAEMAAVEISGQLVGQRVEVRLVDGDPELTVRPDDTAFPSPPPPPAPGEEVEARITLRIPGYLKELIAEAAEGAGDSVNSFVVDALRNKAYERTSRNSVRKTIDL